MLDIEKLREALLPPLLPYGLRRLSIFGSVARGDDEPGSDLDVLVEFEVPRRKPLGLVEYGRLEDELSARAGKKVDLVFRSALKPRVRPYVEHDEVVLYEAA